jgi:hypothetical protein
MFLVFDQNVWLRTHSVRPNKDCGKDVPFDRDKHLAQDSKPAWVVSFDPSIPARALG